MPTLLLPLCLAVCQDAELFRPLDLQAALQAAETEHKSVLVHFTTDWDRRRPDLSKYIWSEPEVRDWIGQHAIPIVVDYDQDRRTARRYEVDQSSTLVLLDSSGDEISRYFPRDPRKVEPFLKWIHQVEAGETEVQVSAALVAADPDDPMSRARYGVALALSGRPRAALEQYLAAWDLGPDSQDPILQRFRRGDMIGNVMRLDEVISGASDGLRERLGALKERLDAGFAAAREELGPDATEAELGAKVQTWAADAAALTLVLKGFAPTYELFDSYQDTEQGLYVRRGVWRFVLGRLAPEGRYQEILDVPADLDAHLDSLFDWHERSIEMQLRYPSNKEWQVRNQVANVTMREVVPIFEALAWAGRRDEALALFDRMVAHDSRVDSVLQMIRACKRAKQPEVGRAIAERALASLQDENDKKRVVRQCRKHLGIEVSIQ